MINLKDINSKLQGGGSTIPVGIHTNVTLEKVEKGDNFVDFYLVDEFGRTKKDRVFNPDKKYVNPRPGQSPEEAFKDETDEKSKCLLQYLVAAVDFNFPDTIGSYENLKTLVVTNLEKPVHKINVKLIPDKNNEAWSTFPRFAPYIERYNADNPATLRYSRYELKLMEPKTPKTPQETGENFKLF